ncbi:MAG: 2-C-methyl-D-erythritol 2,4-cyclodiphosphate synthase [Bacteroidetes bacterium]|nr:2-C-methyl-D-erythritol 2,4-cyclodiphosphate synthase [Bacteroidota bacterium]
MSRLKIGIGYDVHKLVPDRKLILGGVTIDSNLGIFGFSDGDVLTHAIADALLGAAALGDIGIHFPDSDNKNLGLSGIKLLSDVFDLISKKGYNIINIDSTIILQSPKIVDHILKMRKNIATVLNLKFENVSVKATTTDKLGFAGRSEGIGAEAIVLLKKNKS